MDRTASTEINAEDVIARLSATIGQLHAELAMRDVALTNLQQRLDNLEAGAKRPAAA